jgi:hypothetical protein
LVALNSPSAELCRNNGGIVSNPKFFWHFFWQLAFCCDHLGRLLLSFNNLEAGSAGMGKSRTSWNLTVTLGMPCSRWGAMPFIVTPFWFPRNIAANALSVDRTERTNTCPVAHPFHLALRWRQQLAENDLLTQARIASREGISRARVTQIMNLLQLPEVIQDALRCPPPPLEIHAFSERRLRALLSCGDDETRSRQWEELLRKLKNGSGE